ncbi:hypothetical protein ACRQ4B_01720 [Curtobacterium sp. SP.BCo]|uniref:hypothetical protein n=1 Tax=Curtobacterium sp. SP.BCo TaxID=3435229 RepID=UPI003F73F978
MHLTTTLKLIASRTLAVLSVVLGLACVIAVLLHGPALLLGALSLGSATTAGTIHTGSKLAPAVFLVDLAVVGSATVLYFTVTT